MTYSEPEALVAGQHSLKNKLGASTALANTLQRKSRAKLDLLILVGDTMNVREFLAKMARTLPLDLTEGCTGQPMTIAV